MKCPKCGLPLPEDSEFCQYCGAKLEIAAESSSFPFAEQKPIAEDSLPGSEALIFDAYESSAESEPEKVGIAQADESGATQQSTGNILQAEAEPAAPEPVTLQESNEGAAASPSAPPQDSTSLAKRQRYCKRCGGAIDPKSKKCQDCGKQYFHVPKHLGVGLLAVLCLTLAGLNIFLYTQMASAEKKLAQATTTIAAKEKTITQQETTIFEQEATISEQKSEIADLKKKANERGLSQLEDHLKARFMDNYVVIVGDSNNRYHKYGCEDLDLSYFYAYNIENAKAQGYRACSKCN